MEKKEKKREMQKEKDSTKGRGGMNTTNTA